MCPSVFCPACGTFNLHHGTCENDCCSYNPRAFQNYWDDDVNYEALLCLMETWPALEIRFYERPFRRFSVASSNKMQVKRSIAATLHFVEEEPKVWSRVIIGVHGPEQWYGYDLTHNLAAPLIEARAHRPLSQPCYPIAGG